jgi:hypothetical protein
MKKTFAVTFILALFVIMAAPARAQVAGYGGPQWLAAGSFTTTPVQGSNTLSYNVRPITLFLSWTNTNVMMNGQVLMSLSPTGANPVTNGIFTTSPLTNIGSTGTTNTNYSISIQPFYTNVPIYLFLSGQPTNASGTGATNAVAASSIYGP